MSPSRKRTFKEAIDSLFDITKLIEGVKMRLRSLGYREDTEPELRRKAPQYRKELENQYKATKDTIAFFKEHMSGPLLNKVKHYEREFDMMMTPIVSPDTRIWDELLEGPTFEEIDPTEPTDAIITLLDKARSPIVNIRYTARDWEKAKKHQKFKSQQLTDHYRKKKQDAKNIFKWEDRHKLKELFEKGQLDPEDPKTRDLLEEGMDDWIQKNIDKAAKAAKAAKHTRLLPRSERMGILEVPVFLKGIYSAHVLKNLSRKPYGFTVDRVYGYTFIKDAIAIGVREDIAGVDIADIGFELTDDQIENSLQLALQKMAKKGGDFAHIAKLLAVGTSPKFKKGHYYAVLLPRKLMSMISVSEWDFAFHFGKKTVQSALL